MLRWENRTVEQGKDNWECWLWAVGVSVLGNIMVDSLIG